MPSARGRWGLGALALLGALLGGCVNMSTLQTARALPVGDTQLVLGGGKSSAVGEDPLLGYGYFGEVRYRVGVLPNFDLGIRATIPMTGGLEGKYELWSDDALAVATGLAVETMEIESASADGEKEAYAAIVDLIVPVYASFDVGSHLALYTSAKYLLRTATGGPSFSNYASGTAGFKLGDSFGLLIEGSYVLGIGDAPSHTQVNAAMFFW
jgi:hypothetical protein